MRPLIAPEPLSHSVLIFALSGLGKSWLCQRYPARTFDTDDALEAAVAPLFPALDRRGRFRGWRALAQTRPWEHPESPDFTRWADTRRRYMDAILGVLRGPEPRMVLTNMHHLPWPYAAYYALELGGFEAHWANLGREVDNQQSSANSARLDGFSPLVRLAPGTFLGQRPELIEWLNKPDGEHHAP